MAAFEELYLTSLTRCPTEHSIKVLAEIMSNEDAPAMARLKAAEILLDWGWGRPESSLEAMDL